VKYSLPEDWATEASEKVATLALSHPNSALICESSYLEIDKKYYFRESDDILW
jgi:hypothetical protein